MKKILLVLILGIFILSLINPIIALFNYLGTSFSVASEESTPTGIDWNGTYFFITGTQRIYGYFENGTFIDSFNFSVSEVSFLNPTDLSWNGTHWWLTSFENITVWDSNWVYTGINFVAPGSANYQGIHDNGTYVFVSESGLDRIYGFFQNGTFISSFNFSVSSEQGSPNQINSNGTNWFLIGQTPNVVHVYHPNWSYTGNSYTLSEDTEFNGFTYINNTDKWYAIGTQTDSVYQYTGFNSSTPVVNLLNPTNNQKLISNTVIFSVSCLDGNNLVILNNSLYGNWSSGWHLNFSNSSSFNNTETNVSREIPDGHYLYNNLCNNSDSISAFNSSNFTFSIDATFPKPQINYINTTQGSQTIYLHANQTDINEDNCWYSIYNSTGDIDIATTENTSFTCNVEKSDTVSDYGTFTLRIWSNDTFGNENSTVQNFTTSTTIGGGVAGGGGIVIIGETNATKWIITTSAGTEKYEIIKLKSASRKFTILFENLGETTRTIKLECEDILGNMCSYSNYSTIEFELPVSKGIKHSESITIDFPENMAKKTEILSIKARDDRGVIHSVTLEARSAGILSTIFVKLISTKLIGKIHFPYFLLFLFIWTVGGFGSNRTFLKERSGLSLIFGMVLGLSVLLII